MNVTRKNDSDTKVTLTITATEAELKAVKDIVLKRLGKTVKTPGFRPGKAPTAVIEKQLDQSQFQAEFLQEIIQRLYQDAATSEDLRPLQSPEVEIVKFVPFSGLEFKAVVEVMPKVTLGDYKQIKKTLPKISVTDKEVEEVIESLRTRMAEKKSVTRGAKDSDELTLDFNGVDKAGKPVAGASGKDYPLVLGSKSFIPGFEEGLVGAKTGENKELKLTFPKDYHAKNLAGSVITFQVQIKEVKELVLPKVDDAFAEKVGPFKTVEALKQDIKTQLTSQKESDALAQLKDEIVEELVKKSKLTLPSILVTDQISMLEHDFRQNLTYRGITLPEYLKQENFKDEDTWKDKELKPQAERRVAVGMVLAEVAEKEKLNVTDEELESRLALYRQQYQQQAAQFEQPEMRREVVSRILTEKTVDRLLELATKK